MTDAQFAAAYKSALTFPDRGDFITEQLSHGLADGEDVDGVDPALIVELGEIWDMAHLTVKDIRAHSGLSQAAFAARYMVPYRTLQDWERLEGKCTEYIKLLLANAEGIFDFCKKNR